MVVEITDAANAADTADVPDTPAGKTGQSHECRSYPLLALHGEGKHIHAIAPACESLRNIAGAFDAK